MQDTQGFAHFCTICTIIAGTFMIQSYCIVHLAFVHRGGGTHSPLHFCPLLLQSPCPLFLLLLLFLTGLDMRSSRQHSRPGRRATTLRRRFHYCISSGKDSVLRAMALSCMYIDKLRILFSNHSSAMSISRPPEPFRLLTGRLADETRSSRSRAGACTALAVTPMQQSMDNSLDVTV